MQQYTQTTRKKLWTNPPIDIPKAMVSALSMVLVQNRNRRTGKRRTLQIAELKPNGEPTVILQLNVIKDKLEELNEPNIIYKTLSLYTGMSKEQIQEDLKHKQAILNWMVNNNIENIDQIGKIMASYYMGRLKYAQNKLRK